MSRGAALLALALAALATAPASAARERVKAEKGDADQSAAFVQIEAEFRKGNFAPALVRLDALARIVRDPQRVGAVQSLRGVALAMLGRRAEALAAFVAAREALPNEPGLALMQFQAGTGVGDHDFALAGLDRMIDAFPDVARELEPDNVFALIRSLRVAKHDARADALMLRLARIGFGGEMVSISSSVAMSAIGTLLDRGETDEARSLTRFVLGGTSLIEALTLRRYEALWPEFESHSGAHMERVLTAAVLGAERWLASDPDDRHALSNAVEVYRAARRYDDADRVAKTFAATTEAMQAIDEDGGWLVNQHALVLHAMGRAEDAERRFAAMRVIDIAEKVWLINMVINRLELLVRDGRWVQADALGAEAVTLGESHGSPYARQLVRKLRVCTLNGLGRAKEVEPLLTELLARREDAPEAAVDGLICLGRLDQAEPIVLDLLEDPRRVELAVESLRVDGSGAGVDPSIWAGGWAALRARPAVDAAFRKVARDLPVSLRPRPLLVDASAVPISVSAGIGGSAATNGGTNPPGRD